MRLVTNIYGNAGPSRVHIVPTQFVHEALPLYVDVQWIRVGANFFFGARSHPGMFVNGKNIAS